MAQHFPWGSDPWKRREIERFLGRQVMEDQKNLFFIIPPPFSAYSFTTPYDPKNFGQAKESSVKQHPRLIDRMPWRPHRLISEAWSYEAVGDSFEVLGKIHQLGSDLSVVETTNRVLGDLVAWGQREVKRVQDRTGRKF